MPGHLSEIGVFTDLAKLIAAPGLVPYEVNVPFWSDGAQKRRWIALPAMGQIGFFENGEWTFPVGTVFVKHFEMPGVDSPAARPLETRVLICEGGKSVFGATYKWREDRSDADLVIETTIQTYSQERAEPKEKKWCYPGMADCRACHIANAGGVLGVNTRQINRTFSATGENQLTHWSRMEMFSPVTKSLQPAQLPHLSRANDLSASVLDRARSFLDVNCANCHRPGGVAGNFDARYDMPLPRQNLIGGPVLINLGIDAAHVISPNDPWRSMALVRVETNDRTRMPPQAHLIIDSAGAALLRDWIASIPGPSVLAPPTIEPAGGEFEKSARVLLHTAEPGAIIRYTLDGSAPGKSSPVYSGPLELHEPATVRARTYKDGMTRSITVQETYIVSE